MGLQLVSAIDHSRLAKAVLNLRWKSHSRRASQHVQDASFPACAAEPGAPHRAVVSRQGASLAVYDLATSRLILQVCCCLLVLGDWGRQVDHVVWKYRLETPGPNNVC